MEMTTTGTRVAQGLPGQDDLPGWESSYTLVTSNGTGDGNESEWTVRLFWAADGTIERQVQRDGRPWIPCSNSSPDTMIWPAWSPTDQERADAGRPLNSVQDYWSAASDRLRDSSKWMATVIGAALAALIGTSPLHDMQDHPPRLLAIVLGVTGLALVTLTLLLVLQVMRPVSVSYTDVQASGNERNLLQGWTSLRKWKDTVESQQDLYLPCGVKCLTSLRQAMIIEELTMIALVRAVPRVRAVNANEDVIDLAKKARHGRLLDLQQAACQVATIGEYYRTKRRSSWATYVGGFAGAAGTALIMAAFILPAG
jgi:hypothetical protein